MNYLTTDHVMLNTVVTTLDTAVVDVQHEDSGSGQVLGSGVSTFR